MQRRKFLAGLGAALISAPAIVRASNLMPIKPVLMMPDGWYHVEVERNHDRLLMWIDNKYVPVWDARFPHVKEICDRTFNIDGLVKQHGNGTKVSSWIKELPPSDLYASNLCIWGPQIEFQKRLSDEEMRSLTESIVWGEPRRGNV